MRPLLTPLHHRWPRAGRSRSIVGLMLGLLLAGLVVATVVGGLWPRDRHDVAMPGQALERQAAKQLDAVVAARQPEALRLSAASQPEAPRVSAASPVSPPTEGWNRRVIRRATVDVELGDVDRGAGRLTTLVESFGGFVGATDTQTDAKGAVRATITAHVPAGEFARALASLDGLGRVTRRAVSGQDVSEEYVDLEARIRNLERHEAQLLGFMGKAQKVTDLLSIEGELVRVRGEIERATGRVRFLKARTELAALEVVLIRAPGAQAPEGHLARFVEQLRQAFIDGWSAALAWTLGLAVLAAQLSPLAIPALVGWLAYRRWASRRPFQAEVGSSG